MVGANSHSLTVWIVAGSTLSSCSHRTRFWSFGRVAVKKAGDEGGQRCSLWPYRHHFPVKSAHLGSLKPGHTSWSLHAPDAGPVEPGPGTHVLSQPERPEVCGKVGVVELKGLRVEASAAYPGDSKRLHLSVSARKRPSCTINGGGPCSGGSWLCRAWLSCGFCWDSSLLHSSDFGETAFFSASTNSSRLSSRWTRRPFRTPDGQGKGRAANYQFMFATPPGPHPPTRPAVSNPAYPRPAQPAPPGLHG